jgi:hypothetical protein
MIRRVAAVAAGAAVLAAPAAAQSPVRHAPEPRQIILVSAETGLALERLSWHGQDRASGQLDLTGEGAADVGMVRVSVTRTAGRITGLDMRGMTAGVAQVWVLTRGRWRAGGPAPDCYAPDPDAGACHGSVYVAS